MVASSQRRRRPLASSVPQSERVYVVPTVHDVLRGRGGKTNTHPGNQRLLELVRPLEAQYAALRRGEKGRMSLQMVDEVHAWGGRFLEKEANSDGKDLFFIMDQENAVKLVEQKFRDEPTKRKSRINKRFSNAKAKVLESRDDEEDKVSVIIDFESLEREEYESWDSAIAPLEQSVESQSDARTVLEATLIHCVSPAHSVENPEFALSSVDELELDDFSLTEDEISEITSNIYQGQTKSVTFVD